MLKCVGYISNASSGLNADDIQSIMSVSVQWNSSHLLTGMLCFYDGNFMQFLEGPEDEIEYILAKIKADRRHMDVTFIIDTPIEERVFVGWSMALRQMKDIPADLQPACCKLMTLNDPDTLKSAEHRYEVEAFLSAFKESLR